MEKFLLVLLLNFQLTSLWTLCNNNKKKKNKNFAKYLKVIKFEVIPTPIRVRTRKHLHFYKRSCRNTYDDVEIHIYDKKKRKKKKSC